MDLYMSTFDHWLWFFLGMSKLVFLFMWFMMWIMKRDLRAERKIYDQIFDLNDSMLSNRANMIETQRQMIARLEKELAKHKKS